MGWNFREIKLHAYIKALPNAIYLLHHPIWQHPYLLCLEFSVVKIILMYDSTVCRNTLPLWYIIEFSTAIHLHWRKSCQAYLNPSAPVIPVTCQHSTATVNKCRGAIVQWMNSILGRVWGTQHGGWDRFEWQKRGEEMLRWKGHRDHCFLITGVFEGCSKIAQVTTWSLNLKHLGHFSKYYFIF